MDTPRLLDGRLKLRHLVLVDALSDEGSVVGAAAALYMTQPVVTRGLHDLEGILGVRLYDRGPRGITPTEFGVAFTQHARAVLAQLSQAARHVEEIADADRGQVLVGTHLAGSNLLLPRAIAEAKREHPRLNVVVRERDPETLLAELAAGRVDVIVGRLSGPGAEHTRRETLYDESVRAVVGRHHPLLSHPAVTLEVLGQYPWILPGVETMLRQELEAFFARNGQEVPRDCVEATSFLTVRQLLIETDMIAVMPSLIAGSDPRLSTLGFSLEPIGHSVGITLAVDRRLSPAGEALVAALRQVGARIQDVHAHAMDDAASPVER